MSDLTNDDLRLCANMANGYLDNESWSLLSVDMVAIELKWSRQSVSDAVARVVAHGSLERKTASIMRGADVVDSGLDIYRLT